MQRRKHRRSLLTAGVVAALALVGASCGDDGDSASTTPSTTAAAAATTTTLAPQPGGSITIGQYSSPPGLDPILATRGSGTVGGVEYAAIYDTVVTYNLETKKYEPRTGELTPNADLTVWTLKLKPNITFSDGTAYDAAAVKSNTERLMSAASKSASKGVLTSLVGSITVVDATTVTFQLKQAWAGFPALFATEAGMIVSPSALAKAGADFNTKPSDAGAGPFVVSAFNPGEKLVLKRNPKYWGGTPYLDEVTFVLVGRGDPARMLDSLKANSIQAFLTRDAAVSAGGRAGGFASSYQPVPAGVSLMMNSGITVTCANGAPAAVCAGKPDGTKVVTTSATNNPLVRRAVVAAIDTKVVNDRAYEGKAESGSELFQKSFPWYPGVPGPAFDLNAAKSLVEQAKAGGWNGKIRLLASNAGSSSAIGLTVATMLRAAGMEVEYSNDKDTAGVVQQVTVDRNYDIVVNWPAGTAATVDEMYISMVGAWSSTSPRYGYSSPDMDAALTALRSASTDAARTAAAKSLAEVIGRDAPVAVLAVQPSTWLYSDKVHGLRFSSADLVHLDKAWVQR